MANRYIGDRAFYRQIIHIAIPIVIQNGISTFVSLLDNIMVGRVGNLEMSGVSIVNQLIFVFNLCIFGAASGAGIFTAQFYGADDIKGVRYTFRFKQIICSALGLLFILVLIPGSSTMIGWFLQGEGSPADAEMIRQHGLSYLNIILWGLLPFAISSAYSGTLRECGQTMVPMIAGTVAVFVNLVLNCILIFGGFGIPAMGARGAAIATVISRYVELAIVAGWTHLNPHKNPFIKGAYRSMHIPLPLLKQMTVKGFPLLLNETLFSVSVAFLNQCYSTCGLDVVNATNIATTVNNFASVITLSLANTIGILMGQLMGSGRPREEVQDANHKLLALSIVCGIVFALILAAISEVFPLLYNTTDSVRQLSAQLILILAVMKPFVTYVTSAYYTIRSGGKTFITMLFDSGFIFLFQVPLAFFLSRFTDMPILPLFFLCQLPDFLKCILGHFMIKKGTWIQNLTIAQ